VLYALHDGGPGARRLAVILADGPVREDRQVQEALQLLRCSPAVYRARHDLQQCAHRARQALVPLPDSPARTALTHLADVVETRCDQQPGRPGRMGCAVDVVVS
jgi:geranylgeranyl pyrophosphate synthase